MSIPTPQHFTSRVIRAYRKVALEPSLLLHNTYTLLSRVSKIRSAWRTCQLLQTLLRKSGRSLRQDVTPAAGAISSDKPDAHSRKLSARLAMERKKYIRNAWCTRSHVHEHFSHAARKVDNYRRGFSFWVLLLCCCVFLFWWNKGCSGGRCFVEL